MIHPRPPHELSADGLERSTARGVVCPFCGEDDFDLVGLKIHLERGWCEPFNVLQREKGEP
jgi:hypothetical protein